MTKCEAKMVNSYIKAIKLCGGNTEIFISGMAEMTVMEMITTLAPNGVRFVATDDKA